MKTENSPTETVSFDKILSHPFLLESLIQKMGFQSPTPVQIAVAPPILEGRNLFAGAKTGSGKTMAFIAPLAERLLQGKIRKAIVLAPTRELVLQIDEEAAKLLDGQNDVVSVPVYGGVPIDPQILAIRHHKPKIFVGTPGRILDLISEEMLPLSEIDVAVLDEADRMCDMGFAPQVTAILEFLTSLKQTLLFSATLPKELSEMMNRFCPDPIRIQVDAADESSETIRHQAVFCTRKNKVEKLIELLKPKEVTAIVFTRTRNGSDALHKILDRQANNIGILHAGFSMGDRERTIRAFREGEIRILIATDVVSRGIDVDRITHVIHYDLPDSLEDYIHRSGRSGRAGRTGNTIAFFERDNLDHKEKFKELSKKVEFEFIGEQPGDKPSEEAETSDHAPRERAARGRRPSSRGPRSEASRGDRPQGPAHHSAEARPDNHSKRRRSPNRRDGRSDGVKEQRPKPHSAKEGQKSSPSILTKTKRLIGRFFGKG